MDAEMKRIFGAFYGLLVGDALGARYEFRTADAVQKMIKEDSVKGHLPMGKRGNKHAGQVTDDSEMALCLAQSLIRCGGFNQADVATAYASWMATSPPEAGHATRCALSIAAEKINRLRMEQSEMREFTSNLVEGKPLTSEDIRKKKEGILQICLKESSKRNQKSLSNGMLMRISPVGIALRNASDEQLLEATRLDCEITHPSKIVQEATQFYVKVLASLLKGQQPSEAIKDAKKVVKEKLVLDIIADSSKCATPTVLEDGTKAKADEKCMGYFGVALQIALHELQNCTSFEESLVRIIKLGGDTDTTGCIGAVLIGAYLGFDAIPKDWIEAVRNAPPIGRDYFFMEPLKNKSVDDFIHKLANLS